jgi:hypothetical protein
MARGGVPWYVQPPTSNLPPSPFSLSLPQSEKKQQQNGPTRNELYLQLTHALGTTHHSASYPVNRRPTSPERHAPPCVLARVWQRPPLWAGVRYGGDNGGPAVPPWPISTSSRKHRPHTPTTMTRRWGRAAEAASPCGGRWDNAS